MESMYGEFQKRSQAVLRFVKIKAKNIDLVQSTIIQPTICIILYSTNLSPIQSTADTLMHKESVYQAPINVNVKIVIIIIICYIYIGIFWVLKGLYIDGGGGGYSQPPPVCSIHLDDATAAMCARMHTTHQLTGGEETDWWNQSVYGDD